MGRGTWHCRACGHWPVCICSAGTSGRSRFILMRLKQTRRSSRANEAAGTFAAIDEEELAAMHYRFIIAMGGGVPREGLAAAEKHAPKRKERSRFARADTLAETLALVLEGQTLVAIAERR